MRPDEKSLRTKEQLIEELRQLSPADRHEILAQFQADIPGETRPQVFLSYSRDDTHFVRDLMAGLERGGVQVWFDVRELAVGENYLVATERGLRESNFCLVVVSPYSMKSTEVARELAIARQVGTPILPAILQDAPILEPVRNLQWIDFRFSFDAPLAALVAHVHGRSDASLTALRLHSATKPLVGTGTFMPLLHRSAPASVRCFSTLLYLAGLLLLSAGIPFMSVVPLGLGLLVGPAALMMYLAFRTMDRKETLGGLRGSLWIMVIFPSVCVLPVTSVLEPTPRRLMWLIAALSTVAVVAAMLILEFSKSFRRRLPARMATTEFWPTWLRWRKRAPNPPAQ